MSQIVDLEKLAPASDHRAELDALKRQQDADYFLTAQLIKPFAIDMLVCDNVEAQTLTRQKKQFKFSRWTGSIGGDISFLYPVVLENKSYTLMVNADAMGKSIQGAGGALVFAAILKGIAERTAISDHVASLTPEFWLREAVTELQKVFESFDGTMLVTAFLGLLDNATGALYYINAEHPNPVLIRGGKVTYIESTNQCYRIGLNPSLWKKQGRIEMRISSIKLQPGDAIICATDGRDDIALGNDADGQRLINQDDSVFAGVVAEAGGDLEGIFRILKGKGELIDDISFLKVQFYGNADLPGETDAKIFREMRQAIKNRHLKLIESVVARHRETILQDYRFEGVRVLLAYKKGNWEEAIKISEHILQRDPLQFAYIRMKLRCFLKLKRFKDAATTARTLRMLNYEDARTRKLLKRFPEVSWPGFQ